MNSLACARGGRARAVSLPKAMGSGGSLKDEVCNRFGPGQHRDVAGVNVADGSVHPRGHPLLFNPRYGLVQVADQIETWPVAPCRFRQRAAKGAGVDRPLGGMDQRLLVFVEILREQGEDTLVRERQEALGIGTHLGVERGMLELREQRPGGFTGVGREGVDIDEPQRPSGSLPASTDHGTRIAVADQDDIALRASATARRTAATSASKAGQRKLDGSDRRAHAPASSGMTFAQLEPSAHAP